MFPGLEGKNDESRRLGQTSTEGRRKTKVDVTASVWEGRDISAFPEEQRAEIPVGVAWVWKQPLAEVGKGKSDLFPCRVNHSAAEDNSPSFPSFGFPQ